WQNGQILPRAATGEIPPQSDKMTKSRRLSRSGRKAVHDRDRIDIRRAARSLDGGAIDRAFAREIAGVDAAGDEKRCNSKSLPAQKVGIQRIADRENFRLCGRTAKALRNPRET